jgi:FMN phosphatase YigB (HAD superfamily)
MLNKLQSENMQELINGTLKDSSQAKQPIQAFDELLAAIKYLVLAHKPATLVEIGAHPILSHHPLLRFCQSIGCAYTVVNPLLSQRDTALVESLDGKVVLMRAEDALKHLPFANIYFINGDRDDSALASQLDLIFSTAARTKEYPLLFIANAGHLRNRQEEIDICEPRSAIEEALVKFSEWEISEIPAVSGLGIIVNPATLSPEAHSELSHLKLALKIFGPLLKSLEDNRNQLFSLVQRDADTDRAVKITGQKYFPTKHSQLKWSSLHKRQLQIVRMIGKSIAAMRPGARPGRLRIDTLSTAYLSSAKKLPKSPPDTKVVCFDMFDTLVRRSIDPPDAVINEAMDFAWLVLIRNKFTLTRDQVRNAREYASYTIRSEMEQRGVDPECNHREILKKTWEILECADLDPMLTDVVENFEVESELRHISAMPGALEYLRACKESGKTTVIASDTYLPKASLLRILSSVGISHYVDHVFSSADHRTGKYSGGLFSKIIEALETDYSNVSHIGDNIVSDYLVPKRFGIDVQWYVNPAEHKRREDARNSLLKMKTGSSLIELAQSTVQRNADEKNLKKTVPALYDLGHDIFGPLFYSFIVQVAERSIQLGLTDLYFLARDGFGFVKVFESVWNSLPVISKFPMPKVHYLYISRSSSLVILADEAGTRGVKYALIKDPNILVKDFLHFCGLSLPDAPDPASFGLNPSDKLAAIRSTPAFEKWMHAVATNDELRSFAKEEHLKLFDYLTQHNFFTQGPKALVDVGWNGTIPQCLDAQFGQDSNFPELHVLLLGRCSSHVPNKPGSKLGMSSGILMDDAGYPFNGRIPLDIPPIIELGASAPHGTTIGYRRSGSREVKPILKNTPKAEVLAPASIVDGWVSFVESMTVRNKDGMAIDVEDFTRGAVSNFVRFYRRPSGRFVKAISECIFSMDWKSEAKVNLVGAGAGWRFYYRFLLGNVSSVTWFYGAAKRFRIPQLFIRLMIFVHREH